MTSPAKGAGLQRDGWQNSPQASLSHFPISNIFGNRGGQPSPSNALVSENQKNSRQLHPNTGHQYAETSASEAQFDSDASPPPHPLLPSQHILKTQNQSIEGIQRVAASG